MSVLPVLAKQPNLVKEELLEVSRGCSLVDDSFVEKVLCLRQVQEDQIWVRLGERGVEE